MVTKGKKEARVQSDLQITHLKAIESAISRLATSIGQIAIMTADPNVAAAGAPSTVGTPVGSAPAMPPPAAATAASTTTAPLAPSMMPGYAARAGAPATPALGVAGILVGPAVAPTVPPAPTFPLPTPPQPNIPYQPPQAGRVRVRQADGTLSARAVSPTPRRSTEISREWLDEFGLGTVQLQGLTYRVLRDSYLSNSFALN